MNDENAILRRLESTLTPDAVLTGADVRPYGTEGFTPLLVAIPADRDQAAEVVRVAADSRLGILPRGGGTKLTWAPSPRGRMLVLSTEKLNRVVTHEPRDLTITVEAGVRLGSMAAMLREHRQRLPLDPPMADRATLGGITATNDSGPLRFGHGTLRDIVVGMEYIDARGAFIHGGGRVVKNAAGFGMHRLQIGAFGSLGVLTEMTLRLQPLAEAFQVAVVRCGDGDKAEACLDSIMSGRTRPVLLELVRPMGAPDLIAAVGEGDWTLVVGIEECPEAIERQFDEYRRTLSSSLEVLEEGRAVALYDALREWPGKVSLVSFKATMKSSHVAAFMAWAGERGFRTLAHAGSGVVYGRSEIASAVEAAEDLSAAAADGGGQIHWRSFPQTAKVEVWQPAVGDVSLMRRMKKTFDPTGIFSPGRWVDVMG